MKKSKFQAAVEILEQLLQSPSRITRKAVKDCLETWKKENRKRLTKSMQDAVIQLQRIDRTRLEIIKKRNTQMVKKAVAGAVIIEWLEQTNNTDIPAPSTACDIMRENVCLVSYKLVNKSKTTGEEAGVHTVRFATRIRETYSDTPANGQRVKNGTIPYYSLSDSGWRSCAEDCFRGVIELPKEITRLFLRSTTEMQKHYAKVAQQTIIDRRAIIASKDLHVDIA
jgi:hypothetical protein